MTTTKPVEYFSIPEAPGEYFQCPGYNATLSTSACAQQWSRAQKNDDEAKIRLHACINCPLGARHAGKPHRARNRFQKQRICARCHRQASRIVHQRLCVSCVNRQYEVLKGRNAKGTRPVKLSQLHSIQASVTDGQKTTTASMLAVDMLEVVLSAVRSSAVRIGYRGKIKGTSDDLSPHRPPVQALSGPGAATG